jgi:hypothetical protein
MIFISFFNDTKYTILFMSLVEGQIEENEKVIRIEEQHA